MKFRNSGGSSAVRPLRNSRRRTSWGQLSLILPALFLLGLASCQVQTDSQVSPPSPSTVAQTASQDESLRPTNQRAQEVVLPASELPPYVANFEPGPGEEVPPDAVLSWNFSQPMARDTVADALRISPPLEGDLQWADGQSVTFDPGSLTPGVRYAVTLGRGAMSLAGEPLAQDLHYTFSALAPLMVTSSRPSPGALDLRSDVPIVLEFNYPMAAARCVGDQVPMPDGCPTLPLTFVPPVKGTGIWTSSSRYTFRPDTSLSAGQTYEITLPAGQRSLDGADLIDPYVWSFETAVPRVESVLPGQDATQVSLDTTVRVQFNTPMDREATAGQVSLADETGEIVPGLISWSDGGAELVFRPVAPLALDTGYQLALGPRARAESSVPLESSGPWVFRTVPGPTLVSYTPADGATGTGIYAPVNLEMAGAIDEATLRAGVRVTSTQGIRDVYGRFDAEANAYSLSWERLPRSEYCVLVSADVADVYGNVLGEPSRFCFETGDLPPVAEAAGPSGAVTLDTDRPAVISFAVRNAPEVVFALSASEMADFLHGQVGDGRQLRNWRATFDTVPNQVVGGAVSLQRQDGALPTGLYHLSWQVPGVAEAARDLPLAVVGRHLMVKLSDQEALVWVTELSTGKPISRTEVQLIDQDGLLVGGGTTDTDGLVRLAMPETASGSLWRTIAAVTGTPGERDFGIALSTWQGEASPWQFGILSDLAPRGTYEAFLLTDRPIYQPGQTVEIGGLLRQVAGDGYQLPAGAVTTTLELVAPTGKTVAQRQLPVSVGGRFQTSVPLPQSIGSGDYILQLTSSLQTEDDEVSASIAEMSIEVTAPGEPDFDLQVVPDSAAVTRGDTVTFGVEALYQGGEPVAGAEVAWQIYAEPYDHEPLGDPSAPAEQRLRPVSDSPSSRSLIAEGIGRTDDRGQDTLSLSGDLVGPDGRPDSGSQQWIAQVIVTDEAGSVVAGAGEVTVHGSGAYLELRPVSWIVRPKERLSLGVRAVGWDGRPLPNQTVDLELVRRTWYLTADAATWAYTDTLVSEQSLETDRNGTVEAAFTAPRAGLYAVEATTRDVVGGTARNEVTYWVGGEEGTGWRDLGTSLELLPDRDTYAVGDVAKLVLPVSGAGSYQALLTVEREGVLSATRYVLDEPNPILEIPILESYAPNVYVGCAVIEPATVTTPARGRFGYVELAVDPVSQLLAVDVESEDDYGPGDRAEVTVRTTDYRGEPVQADVTLAVVDQAAVALRERSWPSITEAFWGERPLRVLTGDGLLVSGDLGAVVPTQQVSNPAAPGGATAGGDAAVLVTDAIPTAGTSLRQNFGGTAYWTTDLHTDALGRATAVFALPDTLATWDVRAWAATADSQVGQGQATLVVEKPLYLSPVTPRYLVPGDLTELAVLVHNNLPEDREVEVELTAETALELEAAAGQQLAVPAGAVRRASWPVSVPQTVESVAEMTFSVASGEYSDVARPTDGDLSLEGLPIRRPTMSDTIGFSGAVAPGAVSSEVFTVPAEASDGTSLRIKFAPSLGALLSQAFRRHQPCDRAVDVCASQLLSAIAGYGRSTGTGISNDESATVGEAESAQRGIPSGSALEKTLDWVFEAQNPDGGWGWRPDQSDLHLTSYVVYVLQRAADSGLDVPDAPMSAALDYVSAAIAGGIDSGLRHPYYALCLRVLAAAGRQWPQGAGSALYADRQTLGLEGRTHLAVAYGLVDPSEPRIAVLLDEISVEAIHSSATTHWEAIDPEQWTTNVQVTSVVVGALASFDRDNIAIAEGVRWLLGARDGGEWGTAYERAWALSALADYEAMLGESARRESDIEVRLNGRPVPMLETDNDSAKSVMEGVVSLGSDTGDDGPHLRRGANVVEIVGSGVNDLTASYTGELSVVLPVGLQPPVLQRGLAISRRYCLRTGTSGAAGDSEAHECVPADEVELGQLVDVRLTLTVPDSRYYVDVIDPYPAGFDVVAETADDGNRSESPFFVMDFGERAAAYLAETVPPGTYDLVYTLRSVIPGHYTALPATAAERFFPEVRGSTGSDRIEVAD